VQPKPYMGVTDFDSGEEYIYRGISTSNDNSFVKMTTRQVRLAA